MKKNMMEDLIRFNESSKIGVQELDIISEGLNVFKNIDGFKSASIFLLNSIDFNFKFKLSTSSKSEEEITLVFQKLIDEGVIANVLNSEEITKSNFPNKFNEVDYFIIIPLIAPSSMIGIIIILLENQLNDQSVLSYCKIHSNYFSMLLDNYNLNREIKNLTEITDKVIASNTEDIVQSTRELKKILDSVQIGIIIVDKVTDAIIDINLTAVQLIGNDKDNVIGSERKEHFLFLERKSSNSNYLAEQEGLLKKNNGLLIPIIMTTAEISLGSQEYYIESFIDITERKHMEEDLQKAHFELEHRVEDRTYELSRTNEKLQKEIRERLKAEEELLKLYWAVEQSPTAIIITDLNGSIEYVNPRFTELTGFKFEEAVGNNPRILKSGNVPQEQYKLLWENLKKGIEWRYEYINKKKNGELFWVSSFISPIRNAQGEITHYLSVQEDISDTKQFEKELFDAKEKAEQSNRLKSVLLKNMSHEFRTPLIGILGFSQILADLLDDAEQNEMAVSIEASGKRLLSTLDGVLTLSQLESNELPVNIEKCNLSELIKSCTTQFAKLVKDKKLEFYVDIKVDNAYSKLDSQLAKKALSNILDNAVKYTDNGSITIQLVNKIEGNRPFNQIKIIDTGKGIALENQSIIFEAFRQVSEGLDRNYEGCGLGLTIAKKIIEITGGNLSLESKLNSGSTFIISYPLSENIIKKDLGKNDINNNKSLKALSSLKTPNILYVEDNPINQQVVVLFLKKNVNLDLANDGDTALKKIVENNYDLILMDINLGPGIDGIEVSKEIRKIECYKDIPIIAVTGYAALGDRERFLGENFNEYLPKPFYKKDIISLIDKLLDEKEVAH